jgi:hypothetical protein
MFAAEEHRTSLQMSPPVPTVPADLRRNTASGLSDLPLKLRFQTPNLLHSEDPEMLSPYTVYTVMPPRIGILSFPDETSDYLIQKMLT